MHALRRDAFGAQVLRRLLAVQEEVSGEAVGDDPVDLLGHRQVERAQAGLDVGDRDAHLHRDQRRRQGRVDVAEDDDQVGPLGDQHRLQPLHRPRRLQGVAAGADLEHVVGRRHAELLEEDLRHRPVVVLAGVDDDVAAVRLALAHRADHRRGLDEVGAGADDVDDSHRGAGTCASGATAVSARPVCFNTEPVCRR